MQIFAVGGSVRDKYLGLNIHDRDWVVVGASIQEMLQMGFTQFRNQFPVFLHPETKEEYALARTENKIESGYNGFSFDVSPNISLEMDLKRRDLTINAIAETVDGEVFDPFHGQEDLKNKMLRHISNSFVDDPVRLLRICRFIARFAHLGFSIAPETKILMQAMVENGSINELTPEQIWKELEKALHEKNPEKFFESLAECGALSKLLPNFTIDDSALRALNKASALTTDPTLRFVVLAYLTGNEFSEATSIHLHQTTQFKSSIKTIANKNIPLPHEITLWLKYLSLYYKTMVQNHPSSDNLLKMFCDFHLLNSNTGQLFDFDSSKKNISFSRFVSTCQIIAETQGLQVDFSWLNECVQQVKQFDPRLLVAQGLRGNSFKEKLNEERLHIIDNCLARSNAAFRLGK